MKSVQEERDKESKMLRNDSEVMKIKIPRSSSQIELRLTNQNTQESTGKVLIKGHCQTETLIEELKQNY